ncbi:DUF2637 domain-containing protein [Nonomuraea sp. NPDC050153]|uniref:DUF2637 domain-containing protein n=1 Tax=Nonomuraea sp. NPDC050153 TaxID=3364359 RepID=UPI0037B8F9B3
MNTDQITDYLPPPWVLWIVGGVIAIAAVFLLVRGVKALARLAVASATDERKGAAKKVATSAALYVLLYFFWAVAAGISMRGLIGFAQDTMKLDGPWPYLLFFALDGAAAFCMVLVTKRAARAASTLVPRLAVWGLVALSAWFNASHAPDTTVAVVAWACIPVIAGVLFELAQAETRNQAANPERRLSAIQWLHPVERIRVLLELAADTTVTADEATMRVRDVTAAAWLYRLRTAWPVFRAVIRWRARVALSRADFSDPARAEEILRGTQVSAQVDKFATLNFDSPLSARLAIASLIGEEPDLPVAPAPAFDVQVKSITGHVIGANSGEMRGGSRLDLFHALPPAPGFAPAAVTRGINGSGPSPRPLVMPGQTAVHASLPDEGQDEGQGERQQKPRKRPARRTFDRINPEAEQWWVQRALQGPEPTWQDLTKEYPRRSRNWAEARIAKGRERLAEIRASRGDNSTPSGDPS